MNNVSPLLLIKTHWTDLKSGDERIVAQVVNQLRPHLQHIAKSILPEKVVSKADDSDVAQDTAIRATQCFSQFKGDTPEAFWAWLVAIQRNEVNRIIERYDAARRQIGRELSLTEIQEIPARTQPENEWNSKEALEILAEILRTLKPDDQAIIRMRIYERQDLREIATRMGRNYQAVKRLYSRAIVRWRVECNKRKKK